MIVLKNLSERIKFLKTKQGIITFKAGEEKEVDSKLINLKNLPNNLVVKNIEEVEDKKEKEVKEEKETKKIEEPKETKQIEETKEEGSVVEDTVDEEPQQEIEEDAKTIIEKEIESLRVKFESVNGKRQKEAINNKIIELEAKLKELN